MTPRPLYRWKSFWFGVLVLGFLGWAWWLSFSYDTSANRGWLFGTQGQGYVCAGRWLDLPDSYEHSPVGPGSFVFEFAPPPFFVRGKELEVSLRAFASDQKTTYLERMKTAYLDRPKDWWMILIPHWLLIALFAVPWLAFLGWRVRKQRRLIA